MYFFQLLLFSISLVSSVSAYAECNGECHSHDQLLAQIATLRRELKSVVPVGTILPYSGTTALPVGYLPCNGDSINKNQYQSLWATIGYTFTPGSEQTGEQFRLPNLSGKTLIGTKEGAYSLGTDIGDETQQLSRENLPPHCHDGTTGNNDKTHTHKGTTGDDSPDHHHKYSTLDGEVIDPTGFFRGGHIKVADPSQSKYESSGAKQKHQHPFTTKAENTHHQHPFTTKDGSEHGLRCTPFKIKQPSTVVRYMIKAE